MCKLLASKWTAKTNQLGVPIFFLAHSIPLVFFFSENYPIQCCFNGDDNNKVGENHQLTHRIPVATHSFEHCSINVLRTVRRPCTRRQPTADLVRHLWPIPPPATDLTQAWRWADESSRKLLKLELGAQFRISDMIKYDQIWSFFCSCWLEQKDLNYLTDFYRLLKILFGGLNYTSSCWLEVSIIGTGANFRNHLSHERYHFPIPLILVGS